jgi:hypothetical protein
MFQRSGHRIPSVLWRRLAAALALVLGLEASGQEVILHLRNGDRITGVITSETTNQVVLSNAWTKALSVPLGTIAKREPIAPAPTNALAKATPASGAITNATLPKPKPPLKWAGEVQLGADLGFSEKNRQLYTGRTKITMTYRRMRNIFDYNFSYGRTEGIVSANRMDGSIKTDYDLTRRVYIYNLGGMGYDEIRKINFRYEIGPGAGYHWIKRTNFLFNTETGINYQAQYLADDTKSELFFHRFAEDATWKINGRLTLDEKFEYFPEVGDFGRYRFRFESNLRYALASNLFVTFSVLDQYDNEPATGVGPNDLQVRSTVGLKF